MSKVPALQKPDDDELHTDDEVEVVGSPNMSVASSTKSKSSVKSLTLEDLQEKLEQLQLEEEALAIQIKGLKIKIKRKEKEVSSPTTAGMERDYFFSPFLNNTYFIRDG
jgi:arginine deiminase